ncbi:hypothetical protein Tco_1168974 [Tanacetum coccineum]
MHEKQNDLIAKEKNVIIKPIDHDALEKLSKHFSTHFVPQKAFWLPLSKSTCEKPPVQPKPVPKKIPRELPTISLVKDSFNKMRSHVNNFDQVITVRTKVTCQNEGTWVIEHITRAFEKDVIHFAKALKEYFQMFDKGLVKEITDMEEVFYQIETEVENCFVERKCFEIKEKEILIQNERLLEHILYQDFMCIAMHVDVVHNCVVHVNDNHLAYAQLEQLY